MFGPALALLLLLNAPLTLVALCLNVFLLGVFIHGHRSLSTKFFFIVARHVLVADFLSIGTQMMVVLPAAIYASSGGDDGQDYMGWSVVELLLTCESLAQMATFHFVALQALGHLHNLLLCPHNEVAIFQLNNAGTIICILVWMWLALLLFLFGLSHCAKRFSPALLYFYDSCYSNPRGGGNALLDIWLAVLLFLSFTVYTIGLWTLQRKLRFVHPTGRRPRRHSLISVSVVQQQQQQPSVQSQMPSASPTSEGQRIRLRTANRKQMLELYKNRVSLAKGLFMTISVALRFAGFYIFPWLSGTLFGSGVQAVPGRAAVNVLGNSLILLSISSHPLIYWLWTVRIRVLTTEVWDFVWAKIRRQAE